MKTFVLVVILFFGVLISASFAGEIVLTNPVNIVQPAIKIVDYSITFTPYTIEVKLNWYDVNNLIVKEQYITIDGNDFDMLMNATVQSGQIGKKFSDIMFKAIRNKCKDIIAVEGTVN